MDMKPSENIEDSEVVGSSRQRTLSEFLHPRQRDGATGTQADESVLLMQDRSRSLARCTRDELDMSVSNIGDLETLWNPFGYHLPMNKSMFWELHQPILVRSQAIDVRYVQLKTMIV